MGPLPLEHGTCAQALSKTQNFVQISEPADASSLGGGVDLYGSLMGPLPLIAVPCTRHYQMCSFCINFCCKQMRAPWVEVWISMDHI